MKKIGIVSSLFMGGDVMSTLKEMGEDAYEIGNVTSGGDGICLK